MESGLILIKMLKITGKAKRIKRAQIKPPNDGIHRAGKEGFIKGVHSIILNGKLVPKGSVGFYYRLDEDTGVKVYLGLPKKNRKPWLTNLKQVQEAYKWMTRLALVGMAPGPHKIVKVSVDITFDGRRAKCEPWALKMDHVHYPPIPWEYYAQGRPYKWDGVDQKEHPLHTPEGYLEFVKELKNWQRANKKSFSAASYKKDEVPKLGDVVYCMKKKRWYLVDAD